MKVKAIGKIAFDAVYEANAERVYRTALHYSDNNQYAAEALLPPLHSPIHINLHSVLSEESAHVLSMPGWLPKSHGNLRLHTKLLFLSFEAYCIQALKGFGSHD